MTIKVVIAEDQEILRESIKFRIDHDSGIKVVGCAGDGNEAIEMCLKNSPDVVLMDIAMPECDGVEATRKIKSRHPCTKVIMLTVLADDENISRAIENGADGYVLKDMNPDDLICVIKNTVKGLRIMHQNVYRTLVNRLNAREESDAAAEFGFSERELEITRLIVKGSTTREIAARVHLSEGRIKNIITDILTKLGLKDRIQLAVFAVKNKIV